MDKAILGAMSPFFIVSDVAKSVAFYCGRLGFALRFEERAAGNPFVAMVGRDAAQLFLKAENGVAPLPNPSRHSTMRWDAFVYAQEPDLLVAEFALQNVTFSVPLKDTSDGLRGFEIRDPDGYVLFFGRPR